MPHPAGAPGSRATKYAPLRPTSPPAGSPGAGRGRQAGLLQRGSGERGRGGRRGRWVRGGAPCPLCRPLSGGLAVSRAPSQPWSLFPGKMTAPICIKLLRRAAPSPSHSGWQQAGEDVWLLGAFCLVSMALTSISRSVWRGRRMQVFFFNWGLIIFTNCSGSRHTLT